MAEIVRREWTALLKQDVAQVRCWFERERKQFVRFAVQLELMVGDKWVPALRYDNAHGFCHLDIIHADGTVEKRRVFQGDNNKTFTSANHQLRIEWEAHNRRFRRELKRD